MRASRCEGWCGCAQCPTRRTSGRSIGGTPALASGRRTTYGHLWTYGPLRAICSNAANRTTRRSAMSIRCPMKYGLNPVVTGASRILILGTLPGDESLRIQEYYANPRNQFWSILSAVFDESIGPSYSKRVAFLRSRKLALWDVLSGADRNGSLDAKIKNGRANDFSTFFSRYPNLLTVVFNGGRAEKLFRRLVRNKLAPQMLEARQFIGLPSTSPTPGKNVLPFRVKAERWKAIRIAEHTAQTDRT
ncbi:MAG: DNA-deoxyinosine glycosylase [Gammaproteobacteria bacterium]|nr:MAG: DNA-deoxyinosine glycosylase [Gammaproteobacteria bacterium]TLZ03032.1 MAG: DNA-deoxyinosine glycosylase [Gammaproteobacteria bacterium]TLZ37866.1 MAG: DNA-deoxyinosine glycosylase [Gammaproteobacteria bacterium]